MKYFHRTLMFMFFWICLIWALLQSILLSASTNKLSLSHEEAEDYAALVMEEVDKENRGYIQVPSLAL